MMMNGTKIVCVDASPCKCPCCYGSPSGLILNNVYVVESFNETFGLFVIGIPKSGHTKDGDYGYNEKRFRLLDELKQENALKQAQPQQQERV